MGYDKSFGRESENIVYECKLPSRPNSSSKIVSGSVIDQQPDLSNSIDVEPVSVSNSTQHNDLSSQVYSSSTSDMKFQPDKMAERTDAMVEVTAGGTVKLKVDDKDKPVHPDNTKLVEQLNDSTLIGLIIIVILITIYVVNQFYNISERHYRQLKENTIVAPRSVVVTGIVISTAIISYIIYRTFTIYRSRGDNSKYGGIMTLLVVSYGLYILSISMWSLIFSKRNHHHTTSWILIAIVSLLSILYVVSMIDNMQWALISLIPIAWYLYIYYWSIDIYKYHREEIIRKHKTQ